MLSQLVNYYNTLINMPVDRVANDARLKFLTLAADAARTHKTWPALEQFQAHKQQIDQDISNLQQDLQELIQQVKQEIDQSSRAYFLDSYERYDAMHTDTAEYILERQIPADPETEEILTTRARSLSDWKFPAVIFRPGKRDYITHLVASDPLYLLDTDHDLLRPALERFKEPYRSRLRPVVIDEERETYITHVPDGQIGMIFALDYFEYRPLEVIRQYLLEFKRILRPGGTVLFSYNNCDLAHGVRMCETKTRCFTPGSMVCDLLTALDFEIVDKQDRTSSFSWIEFRKPGQLRSLRGGQSLAKIIDKVREDPYNNQYDSLSQEELRKQAVRLNIPDAEYMDPAKLAEIINNLNKGNPQ